ncbi:MAG: hypothetical protein JNK47_16515 [Mesorhizobium sp.]|nr:hypothetical protein [Mesorhizobium sp.]MBL8578827.1 hypothetical protein [Mesorhizobium sp.]
MDDTGTKKKRKTPNRSEKRSLRAAEIVTFLSQYGRKAQKYTEPNDRRYSSEVEREVKRLPPQALDDLMREDEE